MKKFIILFLIFLVIIVVFISCKDRGREPSMPMVQKNCKDSVKGEYHSYFDSVEKCIEKEADLKKEKK